MGKEKFAQQILLEQSNLKEEKKYKNLNPCPHTCT